MQLQDGLDYIICKYVYKHLCKFLLNLCMDFFQIYCIQLGALQPDVADVACVQRCGMLGRVRITGNKALRARRVSIPYV